MAGDAKFKLEDILNKQKAPPQILDLADIKIETEEDFKNVIEKIPDYRIKPERPEETREQMEALLDSMKRYKRFRRAQTLHMKELQAAAAAEGNNATSRNEMIALLSPRSKQKTFEYADTEEYEDVWADMHAKEPVSWKAVVLRRRQEIKEILYKAVDLNLQEEEWDLECADDTSDESDHCLQDDPMKTTSQGQGPKLSGLLKKKTKRHKRVPHIKGPDGVHFPEEHGKAAPGAPSSPSHLTGGGAEHGKKSDTGSRPVGQTSSAKLNLQLLSGPVQELPYEFADPCPVSMRKVNIADLSSVNINWKMLTLARPDNKTDEEIFSKLVQLDKLRLQTKHKEEELRLARGGKDPFIVVKNPSASKGGVAETSIKVCAECSEEFCSGTCREFQYDSYQRLIIEEKEKDGQTGGGGQSAINMISGSGGLKTKAGKGKKKGFRGGGKKPKGKSAAANLIASMNF